MNALLKAASALGLALTVVPAVLVFVGGLPWDTHAWLMLAGTALWFTTAPLWMRDVSSPRPDGALPDDDLWEQRRVE